MRLGQLHNWLGNLIESGTDEDLPVCLSVVGGGLPSEVDRAVMAEGDFSADVSPYYAGFMQREGTVLVLVSGVQSLECLVESHKLIVPEPDIPLKTWPEGNWRKE